MKAVDSLKENKMDLSVRRIINSLKRNNYAVFEDDSKNFNLNIVGIRSKDERSNRFNDCMIIFWKYLGYWSSLTFPITTDPGIYWREHPMNIRGTAVLKSGQYRGMWSIGKHQGRYLALVQTKPCIVYRDSDKDDKIDTGGVEDKGLFGINHHRANPKRSSTQVDKWSAGCQVQPNPVLFDMEMQLFNESSKIWGNSFTYTLLEEKDF